MNIEAAELIDLIYTHLFFYSFISSTYTGDVFSRLIL